MDDITVIASADAPAAIGPYSQAIRHGATLYCSGCIPLSPATGQVVGGDSVAAQAEQVLANLAAVLAAGGSALGKVLKTTVYLADMADFAAMNAVYERHFGAWKPARTTVAVKGLPRNVKVEIDAVAAIA